MARFAQLKRELAARSAGRRSRWYCDRAGCDGEPHEGWHFCEHPLPHPAGEEFWRCRHARAAQHPPAGDDWLIWVILAGRGWGKSRTGAEWLVDCARKRPKSTWAVVAPTRDDLRETCIEGESGLLVALDMARGDENYDKSNLRIRLGNGSMIRCLSAERPERARGPNLAGLWADELAIWRYPHIWDDLSPALRRGKARAVVTTTPKPTPLVRMLAERENTVITRGSTFDNVANLAGSMLTDLRQRWEGTRMARQELYGELLTDTPGALWTADSIELGRARFAA